MWKTNLFVFAYNGISLLGDSTNLFLVLHFYGSITSLKSVEVTNSLQVMRLYEGSISEFNRDVLENKAADRISSSYEQYYRRRASQSEYRAWQQSLNFLKNSF